MKFYYDRILLKISLQNLAQRQNLAENLNFIKVKFYRIEILSQ